MSSFYDQQAIHRSQGDDHSFMGLKFLEDNGQILVHFTPGEEHQGFPGIVHGGVICTLLDETIGRALVPLKLWAMTVQLDVSFRAPVPIGRPVTITGRIVEIGERKYKGTGEILLEDGTIAAEAVAMFARMPEEKKAEIIRLLGLSQEEAETRIKELTLS